MPQIESWLKLYSSDRLDIRICAANHILEHADEVSLDVLVDILKSLAHQGLGAKVQQILLKSRDSDIVGRMIGLLDSQEDFIRETACKSLGLSNDYSVIPHLLRMIDDPKMTVRRAAVLALASLKDETAIPILRKQLHEHRDDDTSVVTAIQSALRTLGHETRATSDDVPVGDDTSSPISLYKARAYERLTENRQRLPYDELSQRVAEVFFLPSFHPETLIRISQDRAFSIFSMSSLSSSLWYHECQASVGRQNPNSLPSSPPDLIEERYVLESGFSSRFWSQFDRILAGAVESTSVSGCDGMSVRAFHRHHESRMSFEAWSPDRDSPQGQFVAALYDLAWEASVDKRLIERLEQLHGYLGLGLPIRWINGSEKCLRIFGRLTSSDEPELRRMFTSISDNQDLTVDMSNFEGMGTYLYPVFQQFDSQHPHMTWVSSAIAEKHLRAIGIDDSKIREVGK